MSTQALIAYHGKSDLKAQMLALAEEHQRADRIVQGAYARFGKDGEFDGGCAVGCTLASARLAAGEELPGHNEDDVFSDHRAYEDYLGVPEVLARLEDSIFEGLPRDEATTWPARPAPDSREARLARHTWRAAS